MDATIKRNMKLLFAIGLAFMLLLPFASADLMDYVEPLRNLDLPMGDVLAVHQQDLYNEKVLQLTQMFENGNSIATRRTPSVSMPQSEFRTEVTAKREDYVRAIELFQTVARLTQNERRDQRMDTLYLRSIEAIERLRAQLQELEAELQRDDADCVVNSSSGTYPETCQPDGRRDCGPFGWFTCDYDDEDYDPEIGTGDVDELRDEARGIGTPWYYYAIGAAILIILILLLANRRTRNAIGFGLGAIGAGLGRLVGVALVATIHAIIWLSMRLVRFLMTRIVRPPANAPGPAPQPQQQGGGGQQNPPGNP